MQLASNSTQSIWHGYPGPAPMTPKDSGSNNRTKQNKKIGQSVLKNQLSSGLLPFGYCQEY